MTHEEEKILRYREENSVLMQEYETSVRKWLAGFGNEKLADQIPFFRDGVTCPETWFREGNEFRPMFILKETSLGINDVDDLSQFLEKWGNPQRFEFVENPFDDIRVGTFRQWRKIARLAKGLEDAFNGVSASYLEYDLSFKLGGEKYHGDVEGYRTDNPIRTANPTYNSIIDKIAVVEIKKVGAGQTVNSNLSLATRHYSEHIAPFEDLLCRQIKLINPTVIVCLGREWGNCISHLLKQVQDKTGERLWIEGHHHAARISNLRFYEEPIATYKKHLKGKD